jgi:hypothetical protein
VISVGETEAERDRGSPDLTRCLWYDQHARHFCFDSLRWVSIDPTE